MTTSIDQAWELAKQRFNAVGVDVENALKPWRNCQFRCTAGRAMTLPVLKILKVH